MPATRTSEHVLCVSCREENQFYLPAQPAWPCSGVATTPTMTVCAMQSANAMWYGMVWGRRVQIRRPYASFSTTRPVVVHATRARSVVALRETRDVFRRCSLPSRRRPPAMTSCRPVAQIQRWSVRCRRWLYARGYLRPKGLADGGSEPSGDKVETRPPGTRNHDNRPVRGDAARYGVTSASARS